MASQARGTSSNGAGLRLSLLPIDLIKHIEPRLVFIDIASLWMTGDKRLQVSLKASIRRIEVGLIAPKVKWPSLLSEFPLEELRLYHDVNVPDHIHKSLLYGTNPLSWSTLPKSLRRLRCHFPTSQYELAGFCDTGDLNAILPNLIELDISSPQYFRQLGLNHVVKVLPLRLERLWLPLLSIDEPYLAFLPTTLTDLQISIDADDPERPDGPLALPPHLTRLSISVCHPSTPSTIFSSLPNSIVHLSIYRHPMQRKKYINSPQFVADLALLPRALLSLDIHQLGDVPTDAYRMLPPSLTELNIGARQDFDVLFRCLPSLVSLNTNRADTMTFQSLSTLSRTLVNWNGLVVDSRLPPAPPSASERTASSGLPLPPSLDTLELTHLDDALLQRLPRNLSCLRVQTCALKNISSLQSFERMTSLSLNAVPLAFLFEHSHCLPPNLLTLYLRNSVPLDAAALNSAANRPSTFPRKLETLILAYTPLPPDFWQALPPALTYLWLDMFALDRPSDFTMLPRSLKLLKLASAAPMQPPVPFGKEHFSSLPPRLSYVEFSIKERFDVRHLALMPPSIIAFKSMDPDFIELDPGSDEQATHPRSPALKYVPPYCFVHIDWLHATDGSQQAPQSSEQGLCLIQ